MPRLITFLFGMLPAAFAADLSPADHDFFEKKVRPILVDRCYECHAAGAKKVKAHLLLDTRGGWERGGDSGPAIVPGDPENSLLVQAVRYDDPDLEMPPKGALPNAEIEVLIEWVERGAPDPRIGGPAPDQDAGIDYESARTRWPYTPPAELEAPTVDSDWPRNEVDRFLLQALRAKGLAPNSDADPATRVRRLYFDLIGLPPTPEQIDAFTADPSDAAWEALVEELLASPQFGERWGRHWLDIARYADSSGGGRSKLFPEAWRYRDYVIGAFNADKPFDDFVREQIAGDLLDPPHLVATGFLLMAPTNFENQDKQALELDVVDEQIDVIGRAFMGMTIGCARCHDHKFDAISHRDYHALAGIFTSTKSLKHANVSDPWMRELPAAADRKRTRKEYETGLKRRVEELATLKKQIKALEGNTTPRPSTRLVGIVVDSEDGDAVEVVGLWKPSTFVSGYHGSNYLHNDHGKGKGEKSLRYTPDLPAPGRYEIRVSHTPSSNRASGAPFTVVHADGTNTVQVNQRRPGPIDRTWTSLGTFRFEAGRTGHVTLGTASTDGVVIADAAQFIPENLPAPEPAPEEDEAESERQAELAALRDRLKEAEREKKAFEKTKPPPPPRAMAVAEGKSEDMQLRIRGQAHKLGERIPRGVLTVATETPVEIEGSGRRALAEWLADEQNPFTARVIANRMWQHVFGEGLVRSVDNFGAMGEKPTHPELLDWLARRFAADGWSVKRHLRLLLHSRAYGLDSTLHPASWRADPENRLLWRAHRKTLEAEALRDAMLLIGGQLDLAVGGPMFEARLGSVSKYRFANVRRSVYQPVFRNNLHDLFEVFDFADSNQPVGRRSHSTLPAQALYLMNSSEVMTAAERAAERLADAPLDDLFRACLGRPPNPSERRAAEAFVAGEEDGRTRLIHTLLAHPDFRTLR